MLLEEEVKSKLRRSERRSMSDVVVRGAEFSGSDILQQSLKGLGFNLCVAPRYNI